MHTDCRPHVGQSTKFDAALRIFGDELVGEQPTFFLPIAVAYQNTHGFFRWVDTVTTRNESGESTA